MGGLIAIVNNGLYVSAIKQVLTDLDVSMVPEFHTTLADCLNGICYPTHLIVDAALIPNPAGFTLEKLCAKNTDCKILTLNSENLEINAEPYVHTAIKSTDDSNRIETGFKNFFASQRNKSQSNDADNTLSDREKEVVQLVAMGKTNKEISDELIISTHTVITHRKNISAKLGIKTIAGLAVYAVLNGLIDPEEVNK